MTLPRRTDSVPVSRSTALHRNPSTSPRLMPDIDSSQHAKSRWVKLRADLTAPTTPSVPGGCDCAGCCPPPLTDIEAQWALRHVSNRDAVADARGELTLISMYGCQDCEEWVPTFTDPAAR